MVFSFVCACSFYYKFLKRRESSCCWWRMRPFDRVARKAFEGPTNRRMRVSRQDLLVEVEDCAQVPDGSRLSPAVKVVQSCLH